MSAFICEQCGKEFKLPPATLKKYPGWTPKACMNCRKSKASAREENLTTDEVLERYHGGPLDGVFTDGSSDPNPGPGGWGAVYVVDNKVVNQKHGHKPYTTNNQMELTALIEGCHLVPHGTPTIIYTDSELCAKTMNEWAAKWEANNWKKKGGPIKNLELVQELYFLLKNRLELKIQWIRAHSGNRWNEYADALSTTYQREKK
jgi:ribonuclease HI